MLFITKVDGSIKSNVLKHNEKYENVIIIIIIEYVYEYSGCKINITYHVDFLMTHLKCCKT